MLKDLNWHPLDQRRIDSRLLMMYKVTYDLVAIPAPEYLVRKHKTIQTHSRGGPRDVVAGGGGTESRSLEPSGGGVVVTYSSHLQT